MSAARDEIVGRIRDAIADPDRPDADVEYASVVRVYQRSPRFDREERLRLFASRLADYDCGVVTCDSASVADTVAGVIARRSRRRFVAPSAFLAAWAPRDLDMARDQGLSIMEIEDFEGVITTCAVAIATTGSIVLTHSDAEGRRALTLLPDYHVCVVPEDRIVDTLPEALARIQGAHAGLITTISGPSATADIEMTRIRGVHGPPTLDVVIVAASRAAADVL